MLSKLSIGQTDKRTETEPDSCLWS